MRCPRCGNENPEANRFCGMCGTTFVAAPTPSPASPTQRAAEISAPSTPVESESPADHDEAPIISGPSFLGLNEPAPAKPSRGKLSIDPSAAPRSGNLDYLLEDDEEPKHGGGGKYILILVALALAVGLGYLRWKNQDFGWLSSGKSKPAATVQNPDTTDSTAVTPPTATPAPTSPTTQGATGPATAAPANAAPDTSAPASNPATSAPATAVPAPAAADGPAPGATPNPADSAPPAKDASATAPDAAPPTPAPKPIPKPVQTPAPVVRPAKVADPVAEAEKYIYGKGVRQDCDHGLRLLKPAVDLGNSKAMIEMGALYSAGLCTPRDLPTAYRWFAMALRKEPDNQSVQTDLQKLWTEMTQPERQLAIKLSQ